MLLLLFAWYLLFHFRLPRSRYYDYRPNAHNAKRNAHIVRCSNVLFSITTLHRHRPNKHACPYKPRSHINPTKPNETQPSHLTLSSLPQIYILSHFLSRFLLALEPAPPAPCSLSLFIWFCFIYMSIVQCFECLYKCDCFCCLFGKLFNIALAFVCIESAYVGWWCGNQVHNEYIQSWLPKPLSPTHVWKLACAFPSSSLHKCCVTVWYDDRGKNNMFFSVANVDIVCIVCDTCKLYFNKTQCC